MNKIQATLIVPFLMAVAISAAHAQVEPERAPKYIKTSGIWKEFSAPFMLKDEHLERITTAVLKAQEELDDESEFFLHVKREDDRYYEVESLSDIRSDPNARGSRVVYFSWNLLQDINPNDKWKKPQTILWIKYSKRTGVEIRIDGTDMSWALLTADGLDAEIKRTLYRRTNYAHILISMLIIVVYFLLARLIVRLISADKFKEKATEAVVDINLSMLLYIPPMLAILHAVHRWDSVVDWFRCSQSYFLWGDMLHDYRSSTSLNSSLFWVVLVGLGVTVAGNVLTDRLLKKRKATPTVGSEPTDEQNREQAGAQDGESAAAPSPPVS